ncbi:MAG TPA: lipopolysaccharide transport periplasmic protein LptA [Geminicoccaceae bacterium]|nr:lipopolysaccharide transport periplasmic protein LptA [Geminicoccus sp.]HMU49605.1 lipopolysaccharide transport periplasmic protein LptA [Geminicoccaceae bacterium]
MRLRLLVPALLGLFACLPSAGSLLAQVAAVPGQDSSEPIDIVADKLVVEQDQQIATFTGNVVAVQGEMTLKSDLLRVFYEQQEGQEAAGAAPASADDTSIRRIEAEGNVNISNPKDTARGDRGVYDLPAQKMTLTGNVVLTSGDNVVKGSSLDMDLATNVSTVHSDASSPDRREQRVRALFVPGKKGS